MTKKSVSKSGSIRHTHATINGIEDAIANTLNIISELETSLLRAKRALGILQELRHGPHAYQRGNSKIPKITFVEDDNEK